MTITFTSNPCIRPVATINTLISLQSWWVAKMQRFNARRKMTKLLFFCTLEYLWLQYPLSLCPLPVPLSLCMLHHLISCQEEVTLFRWDVLWKPTKLHHVLSLVSPWYHKVMREFSPSGLQVHKVWVQTHMGRYCSWQRTQWKEQIHSMFWSCRGLIHVLFSLCSFDWC